MSVTYSLQNELLTRIRKASFLEDFENRNCGGFHRIFPCDDQVRHAKYCQMLEASFNLFLSGRGKNIHKEIERNYNNKLRVSKGKNKWIHLWSFHKYEYKL